MAVAKDKREAAPAVQATRAQALSDLADRLGHRFQNPALLERALRHSSYTHEHAGLGVASSNEQLEFLGDAVLALTVSDLLLKAFPEEAEGALSRRRAALVNARTLAAVARDLDLGVHLLLGRGEARQGGRDKPSLLADALEAVLAAVYLDGGIRAARALIRRWFAPMLQSPAAFAWQDSKTALQELVQARYKVSPAYHLVEESGPSHAKRFCMEIRLGERVLAQGEGGTKKEAAQDAARRALAAMAGEDEKVGRRQRP
jgi:ribonuclease-3